MSARSDIQWWFQYAAAWNGVSMLLECKKQHPDMVVTSDTSGNWGCGAYCESQWLQLEWEESTKSMHITIKEFIPIVMAAAIWGNEWMGKAMLFRSDNAAVVAVVNSGSSRDHEVMHLMRCLVFIAAKFNFIISAAHIPGVHNQLADALSRDNSQYFLSHYPQAQRFATPIPQALVELLMVSKPDCISTLEQSAEYYFQQGLAPSTQRAYKSAKKHYTTFCREYKFCSLRVSETQYVSFLANQGIAHTTIKVYLSTVCHLQIANHMPDPKISNMARLEQVIKGIKGEHAYKSPGQRTCLPIMADLMRQMKSILMKNRHDEDNIMLWAAMNLVARG